MPVYKAYYICCMHPISKTTKLDYINSVRGIAIVMVILLHISQAVKGLPDTFTYMSSKGSYGVQLFFIASAFTLFLSYSRKATSDKQYTVYNFFIRRFFRISPMYYLAALFYSIVCFYVPAYNDGHPLQVSKVLLNLLYVNTFVPGAINYLPPGGWSVGVEMLFYCCVPFFFARIKNLKSSLWLFAALVAVAVLLRYSIRYELTRLHVDYHNAESWFLYFWFPNQVAVFALGIVLYFLIQRYRITNKFLARVALLASTALLLLYCFYGRTLNTYGLIPDHFVVAAFLTLNVFLLSQQRFILFDNRILRFLGEMSFSLYLVHFIVIKVTADILPVSVSGFERYGILVAATFTAGGLVSWFSYRFIELKGIALGDRFIRQAKSSRLPPATAPKAKRAAALSN